MKFSSNRQVDSAKNLELKNSFPIHITYLDMKPKSSQAHKSHGALGSNRKKGTNDSVSSDASVVTLKASNKGNTRKTMNPEQLQAFRIMRDGITEIQKKVMVRLLQALIDVYADEEGRRIVFHQIVLLMSNQEPIVLVDFMYVLRGLSPRAIAKAMNLLRDGFLSEVFQINEGQEEDGNDINESDIDLISEESSIGTFSVSALSNESLDPNRIFDEEKTNA